VMKGYLKRPMTDERRFLVTAANDLKVSNRGQEGIRSTKFILYGRPRDGRFGSCEA